MLCAPSPAHAARASNEAVAAPSTPDKNTLRFIDEFLKYVCLHDAQAAMAFARVASRHAKHFVEYRPGARVSAPPRVQTIGGGKGGA